MGTCTGLTSPGCRVLLLTSQPRLPQLLCISIHPGPCPAFCFLRQRCRFCPLWALTPRSLLRSQPLFFFLDVLTANPTQPCFRELLILHCKFHPEKGNSVDWQSLAVLFGIISELLNVVRCSALRCSHELTLKKLVALQIMKGITSAHSKCFIFHFGF